MDIEEIASSWWTKREARVAVAHRIKTVLDKLSDGETIGSTKLLRAICGDFYPSDKQAQAILVHIKNARDDDLLEGYFHRGKKGPTGHPLVIWHPKTISPKEAADDARSAAEVHFTLEWHKLDPATRPHVMAYVNAKLAENGY